MALLVLLFIVFLPKIEGQFREIDSCPLSIYEWKRREALFQCPPDTNYHCILMYNTSQLYEACMVAGTIQPGKVGCPWILFNEDIPILGSKNSECPVTNPNCPPSDHRGFLTNQLYQYPACFIHRSARTSKIIDLITRIPSTTSKRGHLPPSSENTSDQNFGTWIVVLIVFTVGAIIAGLIAYVLRRKIKEKCMSQQSRQFSKDDIKYEKERFMTDGETVTPRVEDVQVTFHPNNHHIDVKQSNDDVTRTNPHQLHQIEVKQSRDRVEDAQSTSPSLQQQSDDKHQEHGMWKKVSTLAIEAKTSEKFSTKIVDLFVKIETKLKAEDNTNSFGYTIRIKRRYHQKKNLARDNPLENIFLLLFRERYDFFP